MKIVFFGIASFIASVDALVIYNYDFPAWVIFSVGFVEGLSLMGFWLLIRLNDMLS